MLLFDVIVEPPIREDFVGRSHLNPLPRCLVAVPFDSVLVSFNPPFGEAILGLLRLWFWLRLRRLLGLLGLLMKVRLRLGRCWLRLWLLGLCRLWLRGLLRLPMKVRLRFLKIWLLGSTLRCRLVLLDFWLGFLWLWLRLRRHIPGDLSDAHCRGPG